MKARASALQHLGPEAVDGNVGPERQRGGLPGFEFLDRTAPSAALAGTF